MAITRKKKENTLEKLNEKFKKADSVIFAGYKGLTVSELEEARKMMRDAGIEYQIAKKRLIKKSLRDVINIELGDDTIMEGPVGVAFGYENSVTLSKVIAKISKKFKKVCCYRRCS
jgi:large subunit ribosomal protein L10